MRITLLGATSAMAVLVACGHSLAQPNQIPPVVVTGEREAYSVTVPDAKAAKEEMRLVPGGSAVVGDEDYREGLARSVKDVLDFVPGVFAQSKYGQEDSRLSIRGSGLARNFHLRGLMLMQDGIPVIQADGSGDFQSIDPLATRYVEVFKGPNALRYGSTTLGGAVNFVSPTGYDAPRLLLRAEIGSFETLRTQMAAADVVDGFDYYASLTANRSNGFIDHSNQENLRFSGNVGYRLDQTAETRFFFKRDSIDQEIPGAVTKAQALSEPTASAGTAFTQNTKRDIDLWRVANKTAFAAGDWAVELGAYFQHKELFHPLAAVVIDQQDNQTGAFARGSLEGDLFGNRNVLTLGTGFAYGRNYARTFAPNGGARGAMTNDVIETASTLTVYGENRNHVRNDLSLVTGIQLANAYRGLDDLFLANGNDSGERSYFSANPKIGLIWEASPTIQVFGNISRSSEPPTFSDLNPTTAPGFDNLRAQTSWSGEVGTRGEAGRFGWDVTFYRAHLKDELQFVLLPDNVTTRVQNVDSTLHQGIELGLDIGLAEGVWRSGDKLNWRSAYTLNDFRFRDDPVFGNNELPGAPRHYYRGELRYTSGNGFYLGPNIEWSPGTYFVDNANTVSVGPYVLFGAKGGYDFGNGLSLFVDARNLANEAYISNVSVTRVANVNTTTGFNAGDGRAVYLGLEMRW